MRNMTLAAIGVAVLALPSAAAAQQYYGQGYAQPNYGQPSYGQPRGDWYGDRRARFAGYPQFRGVEAHIRGEIMQGVRDDLIERDDARDLMGQLRDIQLQEAREFRVHGWNLPDDDQHQIRSRLDQLDRLVDQIRDQS
ncbi:MAG: hypothetical protein JWR47_3426 [Phenylobacterium sp.]|jgi:hypothetical protein|nr:hypothetical protein [Phenylobacterium sp.]